MLNRHTVFEVSREGYRLLGLKSPAIGRKLRRFLQRVCPQGFLSQSFAFDEGFNALQLKALAHYAAGLSQEAQAYVSDEAVSYIGVVRDDMFGLVANHYQLRHDVASASVAQLLKMVESVTALSDCMHRFVADINATALYDCPEYAYRNLPCSIVADEALWCVSGQDVRGGSGVLEWCYDQADARDIYSSMQRFPERFKELSMGPWSSVMAGSSEASLENAFA